MSKRCLVAICHNGPNVPTVTAMSLMELGWGNRVQEAKDAHGFDGIDLAWSKSFPRVDALRDFIVERALEHDLGYTHVLFLDADMVWPTDVLLKMLRHYDQGIVSGLYHLKGGDYAPVALGNGRQEDGAHHTVYEHDRDYRMTGNALRPQQVVGMGCTLIPLEVFKAIGPRPWFHYENDGDGWPLVSEDVPFCRKARASGYAIWLDPTVKCGHLTTHTVTEKWHVAVTEGMIGALMQAATK